DFKLDEPWNSPHNIKLLERMPAVFLAPGQKSQTDTFYRVFTGEETVFPGPKGLRFTDIMDGTSNTLLVVEAAQAVPWTKPDELPYDPKAGLPALGGAFPDGFHVLFADGHVRFLPRNIDVRTLRGLITPNGRERLHLDD